ncbi:hypothetical protein StoSoilA2_19480 [Arthrobacter sp. StoSoilA2]|uniref:Dabb family protein n=1 Tax=Arthrobacter sp. StoSoilA2 TaxID=2830990 RepID=UPI001E6F2C3D|nr:Dabb family protein [Arthrobacter sp. StoSoilA2]BCW35892.1 hypothetical protein StoSoilA2_19480 [Arthrobacter sp. StoSoilA2]
MKDDLASDEREEVCRQIASLENLPSTLTSRVCQDVGNPDDGFTHSAIITFSGEADYLAYLTDPDHADVIDYVLPRWKKMMFCDASEEFDPGMYGRIQDTVVQMSGSPELRAHIGKITARVEPRQAV